MTTDLFDPSQKDSIVRRTLEKTARIDLAQIDIDTFDFDDTYLVRRYRFPNKQYMQNIERAVGPIVHRMTNMDFPRRVHEPIFEAIKNAHEHGNKRDPKKYVTIGITAEDPEIRIAIADQGGIINADFQSYVLSVREGKTINYYEFSGRLPRQENKGTGINFMHTLSDRVEYLKGADNGLVVQLTFVR